MSFMVFEDNMWCYLFFFHIQLQYDKPLANSSTRYALSQLLRVGGTHVRMRVGVCRAAGAGPRFSRNDHVGM